MAKTKTRIMLVDAQDMYACALKRMLESSTEIRVQHVVKNGKEAVDLLFFNRNLVDIILIDITEKDEESFGIAYASYLRRYFPDIKILALSNQRSGRQIYNLHEAGIHGFIFKDSLSSEILDAINTLTKNQEYYENEAWELLRVYLEHHAEDYSDSKPYLTKFEKGFLDKEVKKWSSAPRVYRPNKEAINWKNITRKLGTQNHIHVFFQYLSFFVSGQGLFLL